MDGHNKNADHKAFKEPFLTYDKGECSKAQTHHKINYTYSNDDNVINMVEPVDVEYCNIITIKGKEDNPKHNIPFFLRGPSSNKPKSASSQTCANAVTHSRAKIVLKGPTPSPSV